MSKPILITGATGKQGGAVLRALLAHPSYSPTTHPIYAVTRDTSSASATRLAALSPSIQLIAGDMNNTPAIFSSLPTPPWGVFSVQLPGAAEVAQGTALVDAAVRAGARKFVYTSVDRHGADSDHDPTDVPHFMTKHQIEQHLMRAAPASGGTLGYTILRPVFFLDNLEWGFVGKVVATAWRDYLGDRKMQVIATADVGTFGATAFMEPKNPEYMDKAYSLAGDELTWDEAETIFRERTGRGIPTTFGFLASFVLWAVKDVGLMFRFIRDKGFGADVEKLKAMQAGRGLKDFGMWAEGSTYGKGKK
ncbi:hypothetical protein MMC34_002134 [Xylographa carneopallida]|nr:hypothetical protein [Xylographa carneopallida]